MRPSSGIWNRSANYGHDGPVYLSRGQSIGQRLIPMDRDLSFLWEEGLHETLDENKQKVREAGRRAILDWAAETEAKGRTMSTTSRSNGLTRPATSTRCRTCSGTACWPV